MKTLIRNITIINEGERKVGSVLIDNDLIAAILPADIKIDVDETYDGTGKFLFPGVIDDQVHFREPGLTHKGSIASESTAAVAGGVTTFMDMPNTKPQAITSDLLEWKYERAAETSIANYSFYIGATNDNIHEITAIDYSKVCGVKVFMGSSTGNMLVDNETALAAIFEATPPIIATHCEDEEIVCANLAAARQLYGVEVPWRCHADIRSAAACVRSSAKAALLARHYGARLHILHLSTADEICLLDTGEDPKITGEVCVHHLWFCTADYQRLGPFIKWNPSIKSAEHREALRRAVADGRIAVVATDHAPHTLAEKGGTYFNTPSGAPMVQHSLVAMLELAEQGLWSYETVAERMSHSPAKLFKIINRGYIRPNYKADLTIVERSEWTVCQENILYKCGWSPMLGETFRHKVVRTYVNGKLAYADGKVNSDVRGERLIFNR